MTERSGVSRRAMVGGAVGLAALAAACQRTVSTGPLRVGVINPQTGALAAYGENVFRGIQLGADEVNTAGGIAGRRLELIVEDDASNPATAATAFTKLATIDRVPLVIGPLSSGSSMATAPLADRYQVIQLSTLAGTIDLSTAGDFVFRVFPSSEVGSRFIARQAIDRFHAQRVALLYSNNAIGVSSRQLVRTILTEANVSIVADEIFTDGDRDFRTQLTNIRTANPEIVLSSAYYEDGAQILRQAGQLGLRTPFLGEDSWFGPIARQIGTYRERLYFADVDFDPAAASDTQAGRFAAAFRDRYNAEANSHAAAGYAAVQIAAHALPRASNPDALKSAMYATDIATPFGQVRFDENGDNIAARYALYQLSPTDERLRA